MKNIQQGDQYSQPFTVKVGGVVITPRNCNDLRVKIGNKLAEYSAGGLLFDEDNEQWLFRLSEDDTRNMPSRVFVQIGVKFGNDYIYSDLREMRVGMSIIREAWNGTD